MPEEKKPELYVPPSNEVAEAEANEHAGQDRQIGVEDSGIGNDESANGSKPDPNCVATFVIVVKFDGNCDILFNPNELVGRVPGSVPERMADPKMVKDTCRDIADFYERQAIVEMFAQNFPAIMANAAQVAAAAQQDAIVRQQLQQRGGG